MIAFAGLLFVAFLVLKLCGVICWSWWWVSAPLWISGAFYVVVGIGAFALRAAALRRLRRYGK